MNNDEDNDGDDDDVTTIISSKSQNHQAVWHIFSLPPIPSPPTLHGLPRFTSSRAMTAGLWRRKSRRRREAAVPEASTAAAFSSLPWGIRVQDRGRCCRAIATVPPSCFDLSVAPRPNATVWLPLPRRTLARKMSTCVSVAGAGEPFLCDLPASFSCCVQGIAGILRPSSAGRVVCPARKIPLGLLKVCGSFSEVLTFRLSTAGPKQHWRTIERPRRYS